MVALAPRVRPLYHSTRKLHRTEWSRHELRECWVIASGLLDSIAIYPDHLEVKVSGAPRMNVSLQEVGLTGGSSFYDVRDHTMITRRGKR